MEAQTMDVSVDDKFARFGSKSFAINKITSVDVRSKTEPGSWAYIVFWALAALSFYNIFGSDEPALQIVVVLVLGVVGWIFWQRRHPTTIYRLFLHTAGSELEAFETKDGAYISDLRHKLETAIAASS